MTLFKTLIMAAMAAILLPAVAPAITLDASFESWVRDDGATLADRDDDLISVWSSQGNLRWGVVEFDLSGLVGTTVESAALGLYSQPAGSPANFPLKQHAAIINPGVATSTLNWSSITALTQTPFESFGAYDLPAFTADPLYQNTYIFSSGTTADRALIQNAVDAGGLLTVVMMAVEDDTQYRQDWGDGAAGGLVPQLMINQTPPELVNLKVQVNTLTGNISLVNPGVSTTFDIDGYVIESAEGALNVAGWNSLENQGLAGWQEVAPSSEALSEVNLTNSSVLGPGGSFNLGNAFSLGGITDLTFNYNVTGEGPRLGTVEYVTTAGLPGDFNDDGVVDGSDFLAWQRNPGLGSLSEWESNFGTAPLAAAAAAVPEPSSAILLVLTAVPCLARRHRA